jgi:chromosome transmission fidelity protein 4
MEEDGHVKLGPGSTIYYKPFSGFLSGINEQFYQKLDDGEGVNCLAVGTYWVAVATTKGYLRVYSSTGQDVVVLTLKGPVVSLAGYSNKLAVFYHTSNPMNNTTMTMSCDLFDIQLGKLPQLLTQQIVPMSSEATLRWCGFDVDLGYLTILDSKEKVNVLNQACGWQWIPVLDIEKIKVPGHDYWPVYVRDGKLFFILLNGESKPSIYT